MILCVSFAARGQAPIPGRFTGEEFNLPIMTRDGKKEMLVRGKKAKSNGNLVSMSNTRITMYLEEDKGGKTTIVSAKCTYDIIKRFGHSCEPVNIRSSQIVIDGVGYDLDGLKRVITIRSRVTVRIFNRSQNKLLGLQKDATKKKPAPKKPDNGYTIIKADTLVYDLKNGTVILGSSGKNTVCATEYKDKTKEVFRINADSMTAFRDKTGKFTRIVAIKDVVCVTPGVPKSPGVAEVPPGRATARRAEYTKKNATIVFSGDPVLQQGSDVLSGAEQAIYINSAKDRRFYTEGGRPTFRISSQRSGAKGFIDVLQKDGPDKKRPSSPVPPQR